jgi:hypothetical protein
MDSVMPGRIAKKKSIHVVVAIVFGIIATGIILVGVINVGLGGGGGRDGPSDRVPIALLLKFFSVFVFRDNNDNNDSFLSVYATEGKAESTITPIQADRTPPMTSLVPAPPAVPPASSFVPTNDSHSNSNANDDSDGDRLLDGKEVNGWVWRIEEQKGCSSIGSPHSTCNFHRTNPRNPDTDADRNSDFYEYLTFRSDPNDPDQDDDGLLDGLESGPDAIYDTSFLTDDTDEDGVPDGQEVINGTNPIVPTDSGSVITDQRTRGNNAPIAITQRVATARNDPLDIILTGSDQDITDSLNFYISKGPIRGQLGKITASGPTSAKLTYTPTLNYTGSDSFTFWAYDGKAYSRTPGTVFIGIAR